MFAKHHSPQVNDLDRSGAAKLDPREQNLIDAMKSDPLDEVARVR